MTVAALQAASPTASPDPQHEVRLLITRYFFGTAAAVSGLAALAFSLKPDGLSAALRLAVVGGFLLLLLLSLAASRTRLENLRPSMLGVVLLSLAMVGLTALALQCGLNSALMGFFALLTCLVCAVSTVRTGAVVAVLCALSLVGLAAAEQAGWIEGAGAALRQPVGLRLAMQLLLLGAGLAAGALIARVVHRYVRASAERERRFLGLLWIAADAYWEMDAQFNMVGMWEQRQGAHGFVPVRRRLGKPPWEMRPVEFDDDMLDAHRADLEARRPFRDLHVRWRCRTGELRYMLVSGEPRFDERGVFVGYWGVTRDATLDAQAHHALAATETRYRALFNRLPTPLVLQRQGRVLDANPAAVALFGYPDLPSMRGQDVLSIYEPGDEQERARERIAQLERLPVGEGLMPHEFRLVARDGRRSIVRGTGVRVEAEGGPATLCIYHDDTERRAAEDAVRRSEALLSHLVATSPDIITLSDLETGRYAMVNETFSRVTGYTAEEVIGRSAIDLGIWADVRSREQLVAELRRHGSVQNMPVEFVGKVGQRVALLVSAARFVMDGRDYLVVNARDVSQMERERKERDAILQNASIGIAFTRDRKFVQANAHCEQMFGWPRGELVGQPGVVVWPSEDEYLDTGRALAPRLGAGEQIDIERLMMRRDGSTFLCRILAKAVDPDNPREAGTIWILDDVTLQRQMGQQLAKARDDAEAASRAKSAFLANTSHELRTPLNGLVGLTRLARQPDLDEAQRRHYLEQISDSAETLSNIISDILDLSKIEAGKLHIDTVGFDLHALLRTLQRAYGTLAQARGLDLTMDLAPQVPRHVMGDPLRVRQILSNYLSNALKFTPHGQVRLRVSEVRPGRLRFEVQDTGPGIDPAVQVRLFRTFTQADQSTTRRFGGTGLGLSICHELATLMHGAVGVLSRPGQGSCFWAELPLAAAEAHDVQSGFSPLAHDDPIAGARVLMVEDNPVNMMIAVALLEQWGVKVAQATTGRQAIEAVEHAVADGHPFHAVLMDVQMPEMSGHEATRALRERHDADELPIIALTAAALVSEREQALAAGMNDFLTKPIDAQQLRRTLVSVMERRR